MKKNINKTKRKSSQEDDIIFNKVNVEKKITEQPKEEEIVSSANYDADIYDTSTDFKSIGVKYIN
jgi:hypothetical protein